MKPFDPKAAKRGDPIQIQDGRKVEFVAYVPEAGPACRVVVLDPATGWVTALPKGDVFMATQRLTVWVNLFSWGAYHYPSQEAADNAWLVDASSSDRIGGRAWPLEIEE